MVIDGKLAMMAEESEYGDDDDSQHKIILKEHKTMQVASYILYLFG